MRDITEELPFDVPESWEWVRLGELCEIITKGSSPKWQGVNYTSGSGNDILFITSENVGAEKILLDTPKYLENRFNDIQSRSILKFNDILTNIVGASIGRSCVYNIMRNDSNINQAVALIRLLDCDLCPFIIKYLNSSTAYNIMLDKQVDSARANISLTTLERFFVPLPPLAEQHRIVERIEELLPHIAAYDTAEQKLTALNATFPDALKKSILQAAVQGKLVPQDPTDEPASVLLERIRAEKEALIKAGKVKRDKHESVVFRRDNSHYTTRDGTEVCIDEELPFEIPDSWEWCSLNCLGQIVGGGTPKTERSENWNNGTIPWLTPADMKNVNGKYVNRGERNITDIGLSSSSAQIMPKNTIIYSSRAPIGYIAISDNDLCTNQGFKSVVPYFTDIVPYLYFCLIQRTPEIQGRASGTTFKEISGSEFGKTLIPLPPISEQYRIVVQVERALATADIMPIA